MKTSNLAERLEKFEAVDSLRLTRERMARVGPGQQVAQADRMQESPVRPARRTRLRGIQVRDQGLRAFRIR